MSSISSLVPSLAAREPLPPIYAALPPVLSILLFLSDSSSHLFHAVLVPPLLLSALYPPLAYTTGNVGADFGLGTQGIFVALMVLDKLVLSKRTDFRRNGDGQSIPKAWSLMRLDWAIKLYASMRGVGWNWEVNNVPKSNSRMSRIYFCGSRMCRAIIYYLAMDTLSAGYMQTRPYFHREISFDDLPFVERFANMLASGLAGYLALALLYSLVSVFSVASFAYSPEGCPDLFGPLSASSSLAGFWGKTWHQSLRRNLSQPGVVLASSLQLTPSSSLSKALVTCIAFTLSAVQHSFGSYAMDRRWMGAAKFFLVQPLGLLFEMALRAVFGRKKGLGWNVLGYFWTATWLLYFSPYFVDELVQAGMWTVDPAPFSFYNGLRTGVWWNH